MKKPTEDLGAAMFRLTKHAPQLVYHGSEGYNGSIEADLRAVLIALADAIDTPTQRGPEPSRPPRAGGDTK